MATTTQFKCSICFPLGLFSFIVVVCTLRSSGEDISRIIDMYQESGGINISCFSNRSLCYGTVHDNFAFDTQCCEPCSCEPDCVQYGTCCVDYVINETKVWVYAGAYKCIVVEFPAPELVKPFAYWFVASCPDDFADTTVKDQCESEGDEKDISTLLPVQTVDELETPFKNKFCAECNGVARDGYDYWNINISCSGKSQEKFVLSSIETIAADVRNYTTCTMLFKPPSQNASVQPCLQSYVNSCPTSHLNLSSEEDRFLEEACLSHRTVFGHGFRNVFCLLCNGGDYSMLLGIEALDYCPAWYGRSNQFSFSTLFDFQEADHTVDITGPVLCEEQFVWDPYKAMCRQLVCPPLHSYAKGLEQCKMVDAELQELKIISFLALEAPEKYFTCKEDWYFFVFKRILFDDGYNLLGSSSLQIGDFEDFNLFPLTVTGQGNNSIEDVSRLGCILYLCLSNPPMSYIDKLLSLDGTIQSVDNIYISVQLGNWKAEDLGEINLKGVSLHLSHTPNQAYMILPIFPCRRVRLTKDEFHWLKTETGLYVPELNWTLVNTTYMYFDSSFTTIEVCLSHYLGALININNTKNSGKLSSQGYTEIASYVFLSLSEICTFLTFLTYCVFRELRTLPGKVNMAVALSLFTSNGLFLVGIRRTDIPTLCKIFGILIHASQLSSILWMNISCFHMFRVFRSISRPQAQVTDSLKTFLMYCLYALVMSFGIVSVNIAVNATTFSGVDIGYGLYACYISRPQMVLYTMVLPALTIVLANTVLFLVVVGMMCRIAAVPSEMKQERHFFAVYIKLSTLTGLSYILAIPLNFSYHVAVEYLYILLNASQGCFVFVAFVCNRRVLNLYRKRLLPRSEVSTDTASTAVRSFRSPRKNSI